MKVIYLVSYAKRSGPINQALNILIGMKENGTVDATFVTLAPEIPNRTWLQRFKDNGIQIYQMNQPLRRTWKCIFILRRYIKDNNIDVIHSSGFRATFISFLASRKVKKVITQRCHPKEIVEKFPKVFQPLFSSFYIRLIKKVDAIVACSKSLQKIFKEEYKMNVECVQNGVNTDYFVPASIERKTQLRYILCLENKPTYLVLGTLRDRKNNGLLIDAINEMESFNGQVVFVGAGPEEPQLKQKAVNNPKIVFVGPTGSPIDYLQASDFIISCSFAEGLPNTILEGLSCGLVPILSDIGPHRELVEGTPYQHIFSPNSKEELIKLLQESSSWDIESQSISARETTVMNHGIRSLAKKYEEVYNRCFKS